MTIDLSFFLKGMILGFSIAAPVGPVGILCIRRTLEFGKLSGFFSGLGAAVADTFYACIAAFGLAFISNLLVAEQFWLRLVGGLFLICVGLKTFFAKVNDKTKKVSHKSILNDFISTFLLTLSNLMNIVVFLAVFAALGLSTVDNTYFEAGSLVLGVFLGASIWCLIFSEGVTLFRRKLTKKVMRWINSISGLIIIGFGIAALLTIIIK